jgi:hypothetical protein
MILNSLPRSGKSYLRNILSEITGRIPDDKLFYKQILDIDSEIDVKGDLIYGHFPHSNKSVTIRPMILLYRHPLDSLISFFHFHIFMNMLSKDRDAISYLKDYIRDKIPSENEIISFFFFKTKSNNKQPYNIIEYFNELVVDWLKEESVIPIKYEDLVDRPFVTLKKLCDELNLDIDDNKIQTAINNNSFNKLSGGRNRGEVNNNHHYRSGIIGEWKTILDDEDIEILDKKIGPIVQQMGYKQLVEDRRN